MNGDSHDRTATNDRPAVLDRLRAWLVRKNPALTQADIAPDTDLIENRILDSLQLVEFVLYIENECGRTILSEDLDPAHLRTLAAVHDAFFAGRAAL